MEANEKTNIFLLSISTHFKMRTAVKINDEINSLRFLKNIIAQWVRLKIFSIAAKNSFN